MLKSFHFLEYDKALGYALLCNFLLICPSYGGNINSARSAYQTPPQTEI